MNPDTAQIHTAMLCVPRMATASLAHSAYLDLNPMKLQAKYAKENPK